MSLLSVLYVDDDEYLLDLGRIFLEMSGSMRVEICRSATEALDLLEKGQFDAVISDYEMPGMDGIEFLQCLRREGNTVPFLVFTGRGREDIAIRAFDSGADFYVQKGGETKSQFAELIHKVRKAVERRHTAAELERTNSLLRATLEATADGILVVDTEGRPALCNRKFIEMWDIPEPEAGGEPSRHIFPALTARAVDPMKLNRRINEINARPESTSYDVIRCSNGRVFRCFSQARMTGTIVTGRVWSFRDITRQDMTENQLHAANEQLAAAEEDLKVQYVRLGRQVELLRESEEKYRAVFDTDPVPLLVAEEETGEIVDMNMAACRAYGYSRDGTPRICIGDLLPEGAEREGGGPVERYLRAPAHRRSDGSVFPASVSSARLVLQGRRTMVLSARDMTATRMIEDALKLTNLRLNLLLGITRHDILNKLTILIAYNEILFQKIEDTGIREMLRRQARATDEIRNHINFTREYDNLGIRGPVWQCVEDIASRSFTQFLKTIPFRCDVRGLEIYADPLLEKVFYNLFDNTFRYSGEITEISLSCCRQGALLVLAFCDNGIGIRPEDKERIFRKGYGKNTGLGLFLSREILSITGIEIRENGEFQKGARFEIIVPSGYYRFREPEAPSPGFCRPEEVPAGNGCAGRD